MPALGWAIFARGQFTPHPTEAFEIIGLLEWEVDSFMGAGLIFVQVLDLV